jgi:SAM-dependent methyltransferase
MAGLKKALMLAQENNVKVEVQQADLSSYKIPTNSFDGIVCIYGHFDATTRKHIHREALHALKPGGFLVIEAYSKEQVKYSTGGPKDEQMLYELTDLEADFAGEINFIIKRKTERNIVEGKYHTGRGSVIQIFGRKQ